MRMRMRFAFEQLHRSACEWHSSKLQAMAHTSVGVYEMRRFALAAPARAAL
jgi:hypothetical protein